MVAIENPLVGGYVVEAIIAADRWGHASIVQAQDALGDELAVETIADEVDAQRGGDQPHCADGFTTIQGDGAKGKGAEYRHQHPADVRQ